jgi:hypothetical protein
LYPWFYLSIYLFVVFFFFRKAILNQLPQGATLASTPFTPATGVKRMDLNGRIILGLSLVDYEWNRYQDVNFKQVFSSSAVYSKIHSRLGFVITIISYLF